MFAQHSDPRDAGGDVAELQAATFGGSGCSLRWSVHPGCSPRLQAATPCTHAAAAAPGIMTVRPSDPSGCSHEPFLSLSAPHGASSRCTSDLAVTGLQAAHARLQARVAWVARSLRAGASVRAALLSRSKRLGPVAVQVVNAAGAEAKHWAAHVGYGRVAGEHDQVPPREAQPERRCRGGAASGKVRGGESA